MELTQILKNNNNQKTLFVHFLSRIPLGSFSTSHKVRTHTALLQRYPWQDTLQLLVFLLLDVCSQGSFSSSSLAGSLMDHLHLPQGVTSHGSSSTSSLVGHFPSPSRRNPPWTFLHILFGRIPPGYSATFLFTVVLCCSSSAASLHRSSCILLAGSLMAPACRHPQLDPSWVLFYLPFCGVPQDASSSLS